MKTILALLCSFAIVTGASAQSNKVVSAFNYLKYYGQDYKSSDILNARKYIDEASVHEKTINDEKTWNYRGQIYLEIAKSNDPEVKAAVANPLDEAYRSFARSAELEARGGYKRADPARAMAIIGGMYLNAGIDAFSAKEYEKALSHFEKSVEISKKNNVVDTLSYYNAALAAERAKNYEKAALYYNECINANSGGAKIYQYLAEVHTKQGDKEKAFEVILAGRQAFPTDNNLVKDELNYYLLSGKNKEAYDKLKLAIEAEPENVMLHYSLGVVSDNLANAEGISEADAAKYITEAETAYKKALEIDPDNFEALYNMGALHFNQGVKIVEVANTITDNVKYSKEVKKADAKFNLAIPYLEKALEINPDDQSTLSSLKQLYARMGMTEKYKAIDAKLKAK